MISSPLFCTHCGAANLPQAAFCYACGQAIQAPGNVLSSNSSGPLQVGALLKQRYQITQQIGTGGFGAVYKAEDVDLGKRPVAVKEMSQHNLSPQEIAEATQAFKQEALLLADLMHEHLPRIYDHFGEGGRWYLVMDYIRGETLEDYLSRAPGGQLPLDEALDIGLQLCSVLNYLHTRQPAIIFRDLKPSNVILTPEKRIFLIDFGIARHFKPGQAKDTIAFGSPGYAPPEQYGKAQTTPRADIYSLGAILHQMLSGDDPSLAPFRFAPLKLNVPALQQLLNRMLNLDESRRPATMVEVEKELQYIKEHPQGAPSQPGSGSRFMPPSRTSKPPSGPNLLIYEGHASPIHSVAWSPDSKYIASASDEIVRVWEAQSGWDRCAFRQHSAQIASMVWAPGTNQITSLSRDNNLRIWDASTGLAIQNDPGGIVQGGLARLLSWSPDARLLALAGNGKTVEILDVGTQKYRAPLHGRSSQGYTVLSWSPDGQYLAAASENTIFVWDMNTEMLMRTYEHSARVNAIAWSPDSFYIASCGHGKIIQVWLASTGELKSMYTGNHSNIVDALAWSPNGRIIVSGDLMGELQIWDTRITRASQQVETYSGHSGGILSVAWSPNGRYLASGGADETVRVWKAPL